MLRVDYRTTYGVVKVRWNGKLNEIKIHPANCLCAFIYHFKNEEGKKMAQLIMFLYDKKHIINIMKNDGSLFPYYDIVSVKLNVFHKEARQLVVPMSQSGYKVQCYYKEGKK